MRIGWSVVVVAGCNLINGLDDKQFVDGYVPSSGIGSSAAGGGESGCVPEAVDSCYTGPPGTASMGICREGQHVCRSDGLGWGACNGQTTPDIERCGTAADENCDGFADCQGPPLWGVALGDRSPQLATHVAVDAAGNSYVTGAFEGEIHVGSIDLVSAGGTDVFVLSFTPQGDARWGMRFGDEAHQAGESIAVDAAGNVALAGRFAGSIDFGGGARTASYEDMFVAKLDSNGGHLWSLGIGATGDEAAYSVAFDPTGNVVFAGYGDWIDDGYYVFPDRGLIVAKLNANDGTPLWRTCFAGYGGSNAQVAVAGTANILVAGWFAESITIGSVTLTANGSDEDGFATMLTGDGTPLWTRQLGDVDPGVKDQRVLSAAVDTQGHAYLVGRFTGGLELEQTTLVSTSIYHSGFVLKLDGASGGDLWALPPFGDSGNTTEPRGVAVDSDGNAVIAGHFAGVLEVCGGDSRCKSVSVDGLEDAFATKLDPSGRVLWLNRFGDADAQAAHHVAVLPTGASILVGSFYGQLPVADQPLTSSGQGDAFVLMLGP